VLECQRFVVGYSWESRQSYGVRGSAGRVTVLFRHRRFLG